MFLSRVVSEIISVWKKYRHLEIWVRGQSRSLKVVPIDKQDTVSYHRSIVAYDFEARCDRIERIS